MIAGRSIALAHLGVIDAECVDVILAASAAGFDAVTLRACQGAPGEETAIVTDPRLRAALREQLAELGMSILDLEVVHLRETTDIPALARLFAAAAELGVEHVVTIAGITNESVLVERFAELAVTAGAHGVRPVLEFTILTDVATVEQATRVVARAGGGGRVLVDPLHLARSGGSPADVARCVSDRPELFSYLQLCDGPLMPPGASLESHVDEVLRGRLLPGQGELPLRAVLDACPRDVPVSVETPVRGAVGPQRA